jgi:Fe-S cluster assembly protein SufD
MLPDQRVEAWKYSDLRAALAQMPLPQLEEAPKEGPILARLAGGFSEIALAQGEQRIVIERVHGDGLEAQARRYRLAPDAQLTRLVLQSGPGIGLSLAEIELGAGAHLRQFVLAEGGRFARIETQVQVLGEGAQVELAGIYLAGAGRHVDLTSVVTHHVPGGRTGQLIKGAARAGGRGVFQGKILVARGAQKTDARQHHRALLLEIGAEVYAKPELEIYADDVACAHGNTAGALAQDQLFYLQSRAIPLAQARAMLTEAFLLEALPDWLQADWREEIEARLAAWLGAR